MARQANANAIINRTALEVGLATESDPVASADEAFTQLTGLLTVAGQELLELHPWQVLRKEKEFTTVVPGDTGIYDLEDDYAYVIQQTPWDNTNEFPIGGPLSPQDWAYLEGRNLVTDSVYISYRIANNKLELFSQPPPNGVTVRYEYISRWWVQEAGESAANTDEIMNGSDIVVYEPILIQKLLKVKFLEAKGFNSESARMEFETVFLSRTGKDEGSGILSASDTHSRYPYLTPYRNMRDSGYGQ